MNQVGAGSLGESVWNGWFMLATLREFTYRRVYVDDGPLLGSRQNDECQIDSIAQT